jgi:hypothetical protein
MLTIRRQQMQVLNRYAMQNFEDRMVRHLTYRFPTEIKAVTNGAPDEAPIRSLVRRGLQQARRYGIEAEREVGQFIELMVRAGEDFDSRPGMKWARAVLEDRSLPAGSRVELVHEQLDRRAQSPKRPADGAPPS